MVFLPTTIIGSTLQLSSIPRDQLERVHLGDLIQVNGVDMSVDQISLENGTLTFIIPNEISGKMSFNRISKVDFPISNKLDKLKTGSPLNYEDYLFVGAEFITPELYETFSNIGQLYIVITQLRAFQLNLTENSKLSNNLQTIKMIVSKETKREDLDLPGNLIPVIAEYGGLKVNDGPAEGIINLCRLAGIAQVGVMVKYNNDKYERISKTEVEEYIKIIEPKPCEVTSFCYLETAYGLWKFFCFDSGDCEPHIVLIAGDIFTDEPVVTRVHSECYTGDVLKSKHCDCGEQLQRSLQTIQEYGRGILIIPAGHEGRCIGLSNKVLAYRLQQKYKMGTYEANLKLGFPEDGRDFQPVKKILEEIGVDKIKLLTGNPNKISHLRNLITDTVPLDCLPNEINSRYLKDKHHYHKRD
jgi:3,4-dihydroxy 2-butanone 4-phosphate synthase / GTP cyclohydrolase II